MRDKLVAKLVWDGESITVPEELGTPREDQFVGRTGERLAEVAGRLCYDSFGQGRSSLEYHKHILQVGHLSVHEHFNITFQLKRYEQDEFYSIMHQLVGRPGVWVSEDRITVNPRVLLDWFKIREKGSNWFATILQRALHEYVPNVIFPITESMKGLPYLQRTEPIDPEEEWISMYLGGSRGFSHEQVRHGDFSAISQRSTRYVDESESEWIWHPLLRQYIAERGSAEWSWIAGDLVELQEQSRNMYSRVVKSLQPWLLEKGCDKLTARKQARGAARGFLGNALYTEMIFSASVAQWKRMISQRASSAADAEIRELYMDQIIPQLKKSRYGDEF